MFQLDKHVKFLQFLAALLAIPAGVAGTYAVYKSYMSGGVSCNELRSTIIATMDRNISADAKKTLLKEDVGNFDKYCAEKDPEARVVFDAALAGQQVGQQGAQNLSGAQTVAVSMGVAAAGKPDSSEQVAARPPENQSTEDWAAGHKGLAVFGLSKSGEKRGWVVVVRHGDDGPEPNFDGFSPPVPPAPGTILTARRPLFVWLVPPPGPGKRTDSANLQGRIAAGECVKVLTNGPANTKFWTEVAPEKCE